MITNERGWKWVGIFLMLMSCMVMFLAVTGGYHIIWGRHDTASEIYSLSQRNEALQAVIQEKDAYIEEQSRAMNFEKLFLLVCKPDSITLLGELQDRINNKAEFCLGEK